MPARQEICGGFEPCRTESICCVSGQKEGYQKLSSILKALKKLESEAPEKSEIRSWSSKRFSQDTSPSRTKSGLGFKKQSLIILLSVTILLVGGGLVVFRKDPGKLTTVTQRTEIKPTKQIPFTDQRALSKDPIQKDLSPEKEINNFESVSRAGAIRSEPHQKPLEETPALDEKTDTKPDAPSALQKPPVLQPKDSKATENTEQNKTIDRFSSLPVKQSNDSGFELQAIAWSSDPKNRIAVVNGRILREGDSIERTLVTHIGENEVVFKDGIQEWRQLFRIK